MIDFHPTDDPKNITQKLLQFPHVEHTARLTLGSSSISYGRWVCPPKKKRKSWGRISGVLRICRLSFFRAFLSANQGPKRTHCATNKQAGLPLQSCRHQLLDCPTSPMIHLPGSQQTRLKLLEPAGHLSADLRLQSCHHQHLDHPM